MKDYIPRRITSDIERKFKTTPAVAILGPRQCGKTTLAKRILSTLTSSVYLDLERRADLNKLRDPDAFFDLNKDRLICLDEIQRVPELFPEMRSSIDRQDKPGQFLLLGSASPELLQQSSESLAGRISYVELAPFSLQELSPQRIDLDLMRTLWRRGGFPRSYLVGDEDESWEWRRDFIRTFLQRDIPQLGIRIPQRRLERFWTMCAHIHGQLLNRSKLGASLGVSHHTINTYIDLLDQTFLLRVLEPYHANIKKRLIKSPKIFLRDTGLLHALLDIKSHNDLLGHPTYGSSWESFVIENTLTSSPEWKPYFYRSAVGDEIDLLLRKGRQRVAIEIKASTSPEVTSGFWRALNDLNVDKAIIVAPVESSYPYKGDIQVIPPQSVREYLESI